MLLQLALRDQGGLLLSELLPRGGELHAADSSEAASTLGHHVLVADRERHALIERDRCRRAFWFVPSIVAAVGSVWVHALCGAALLDRELITLGGEEEQAVSVAELHARDLEVEVRRGDELVVEPLLPPIILGEAIYHRLAHIGRVALVRKVVRKLRLIRKLRKGDVCAVSRRVDGVFEGPVHRAIIVVAAIVLMRRAVIVHAMRLGSVLTVVVVAATGWLARGARILAAPGLGLALPASRRCARQQSRPIR